MIAIIKRAYDSFFGAGEAAVTVPPMDGAFLPNNALENADVLCSTHAPDNLLWAGENLIFSSGTTLNVIDRDGNIVLTEEFAGEILAVAANPEGSLAISLKGTGIVFRGGPRDGQAITDGFGNRDCLTALAFDNCGNLLVTIGSNDNSADDWARDLLQRRSTGGLFRIGVNGKAEMLATGLGWPAGVSVGPANDIVFSESWRHRIVTLDEEGGVQTVAGNLPAYPGRIVPAGQGGWWLSLYAPRRQMIEFILRERAFREKMMAEIPPGLWMAPALSSGTSFREPLQGGAVKQLGVLKPWAPTRSYGLVAHLDEKFVPTASYHSRADGTRHGITSAVAVDHRLFATARGGDVVLSLPLNGADGGAK